jgi:hypothetical protein
MGRDRNETPHLTSVTIDPGIQRIVAAQPYPLMFATTRRARVLPRAMVKQEAPNEAAEQPTLSALRSRSLVRSCLSRLRVACPTIPHS